MSRKVVRMFVAAVLATALAAPAGAQGSPPGTISVTSALTGIEQVSAKFDAGGDVQWRSLALTVGVTRQFVPAFSAGLSGRYDLEDWRIRPAASFGGRAPWEHLERPGATLNLSLALSKSFFVRVSPTVEWARDTRADLSDACIYGANVSAAGVVSPGRILGAGASVSRQFYSIKVTPFVVVNWKLTDRLRVANSTAAGPLGGAGVELRWTPASEWELAVGGVWRSDRWRIAAPAPGVASVGETSAIPGYARATRTLGTAMRLDLYAGGMTSNRLTLRDENGHDLGHDGFATTPAFAATLSAKR